MATCKRLITRQRGKRKPPDKSIQFRFMNGWHYRDLGRVAAVWVLQPDFLGANMNGPIASPHRTVSDFFGRR